MTTPDAETIAQEVGRAVLRVEQMFNAKLIERAKARVVDDATSAILSYLASRREAEPVAYRIHAPEDEHYGTGPDRLQFHPLAQYDLDNGYRQTPLYTAPPSPAGEVERLRGEIAYAITKRLVIDMPTARAAIDEAFAAINGVRHD